MKTSRSTLFSVAAVAVCMAAFFDGSYDSPHPVQPTSTARSISTPEKEAREALAQFYVALGGLFQGDMKLMNDVWSHADDVTYMGPGGGLQVGWKNVSEELARQAAMKMGGKIEPSDIHMIAMAGAMAVVSNYEKGENNDAEGKKSTVSIRATSSFRYEGGKWKMIGHHTDLIPRLAK